ncbi:MULTISPECIES: OmpH family outer membrane protein [Caulobacter]|jgi:Skp family chaperone for outer membrane proteins|uniref:Periplasmic chaperone for outer membrane proteins Skp n=1 Tax=Caulobacter vibrioides OR37 TaxID=1292034 RepID=R0EPB0_CAUVI|nr:MULTISPECIES: OmpH family outer membrane protein [Caulobacter]ENZ83664.1 periplasmic chaperone for outer membrane proteins Skp [Caulobacter vibrioides OR37]MBQ1560540.1 OmpH family outer membrane protein [Caulobacter sp.]
MSKFLSAAASSVVALAIATAASAQTAPAAAPAAPPVTHGPAISGVCIFSSQRAVASSLVGKAVDARLKTIIQQVNAELNTERTGLDNEAKALDAKKGTLAQDALEQQAAALQVKANAWQRKGQLRQKEVEATEQKALNRVYQELDTPIRQVYQSQKCSLLLDRESVMLANPAMDITDAVVAALDARIKTLTFDRERLDQAPVAGALQPTNK